MSARPVEAHAAPFSRGGSYSDAGVALDEISSLTANVEPVLLRVKATGGTAAERRGLAGDWLCADHDPPARVPKPSWTYTDDARRWAAGREWIDAWELCRDGSWLLYEAALVGVDRRLVTLGACACARASLAVVRPSDARAADGSLAVVESWAKGHASMADLLSARDAAAEADADAERGRPADGAGPVSSGRGHALYAVTSAARAAVLSQPFAPVNGFASAAAYTANAACIALYNDTYDRTLPRPPPQAEHWAELMRRLRTEMADVVRAAVPTAAVLRAAARSGSAAA